MGFGILGFLAMGFAPSGMLVLIAVPLLSLWRLAGPSIQALMTRQVDPHEQGRLQGAVSSLVSLGGIFGPVMFSNIFAMFIAAGAVSHLPGAAFMLASGLLMLGWALAWRATRPPVGVVATSASL
jgi:MFS transporter, DHA1 family, tetracycline resistance protein